MSIVTYVRHPTHETVAFQEIVNRYGTNCLVGEINDLEDHWRILVDAYLPDRVVDEETEKEKVLSFHLKNVAEVTVDKQSLQVVNAIRQPTMLKNIRKERAHIRTIVEEDLARVVGDPSMEVDFGKLTRLKVGLAPIYKLTLQLLEGKHPSVAALTGAGYSPKKQIWLLRRMNYAKIEDGRFYATNKLTELYSRIKHNMRTADVMLGLVVSSFYRDLRRMRLSNWVSPYLKIGTAYYENALKYDSLMAMTPTTLRQETEEFYTFVDVKKQWGIDLGIRELVEADILNRRGEYIIGRQEIADRLEQVKGQMPVTAEYSLL